MSPCNKLCPCRKPRTEPLTIADRLEIEQNHWPDGAETEVKPVEEVSAAQGDVHWLDWHDSEQK